MTVCSTLIMLQYIHKVTLTFVTTITKMYYAAVEQYVTQFKFEIIKALEQTWGVV